MLRFVAVCFLAAIALAVEEADEFVDAPAFVVQQTTPSSSATPSAIEGSTRRSIFSRDWSLEIIVLVGCLIYVAFYFYGRSENQRRANALWDEQLSPWLRTQFAKTRAAAILSVRSLDFAVRVVRFCACALLTPSAAARRTPRGSNGQLGVATA
jgi:hypothetical protein